MKVYFISNKNILFFIVTIYIYTFLLMVNQFSHSVSEKFWPSFLDSQPYCILHFYYLNISFGLRVMSNCALFFSRLL